MPTHSPDFKHFILTQYRPHSPTQSFEALARTAGGGLSATTIARWYSRWDGTPSSLERAPVKGRPRVLTRTQLAQQIARRVKAANRNHTAVHYTSLLPLVRAATDTTVSLRTIQRYGKEEAGIRDKRTKKRTQAERKYAAMVQARLVLSSPC